MNSLEKYQPLILLIAILMGVMTGGIDSIKQHAGNFIVPFLMLMLYGLFLLMPLKRVFTSFKKVKFVARFTRHQFFMDALPSLCNRNGLPFRTSIDMDRVRHVDSDPVHRLVPCIHRPGERGYGAVGVLAANQPDSPADPAARLSLSVLRI